MTSTRFHIVFNSNAGTALTLGLTADALLEQFVAAGLDATIDADAETPFADRIAAALADEAEVIVAAGGDGTVTALAEAMVGSDKTLAVLPLGTANLLARDLGVPLDLAQAVAAMPAMAETRIDVGEVNGRIFLHNVTVGTVPGIAAGREQIRGRNDIGALIGFARYFFRRLARARRIAVEIAPEEGENRVGRVQAVVVANNTYDEGFGHVFSRKRLDRGKLGLYTLKHLTAFDVIRLSAGMVVGRWRQDEALTIEHVSAVTIRSKKETVMTMFDGEIESFTVPLRFRIRPLALSVLAPLAVEATTPLPEAADLTGEAA
jgi:diacylglycerol kinase family enzyme